MPISYIFNISKHQLLIIFIFFSLTFLKSQEISVPKFGKGILQLKGQEDTWSMNLSFRMQLLTMADFEDNQINNSSYNSLIRRSRIKMSGFAINPKLKYKVELGLSNRDLSGASDFTSNSPRYILDAYIDWNFYKNFRIRFGQGKLPGNMERVISSGNLSLVDRSILNSKFTIDRSFGIQFRNQFNLGKVFLSRQIIAISPGEGRNVTTGNIGEKKIIFTVSPIPLYFTFTDQDIVVANKYSKSILRSAVDQFIDNKDIFYFPSFEIIQDCVGWPNSFKEDKRHVKLEVFKKFIVPTFIHNFTNL